MVRTDKVFVTGVHSSGKSVFAKQYGRDHGLPYISFDELHDYKSKVNQSKHILSTLQPCFVLDAIPIDENGTWKEFAEYECEHDVLVVCVYCPDRDVWLTRVHDKLRKQAQGWNVLAYFARRLLYKIRYRSRKRLEAWPLLLHFAKRLVNRLRRFRERAKRCLGLKASTKAVPKASGKSEVNPLSTDDHTRRWEYRRFFRCTRDYLDRFKNVQYFDSIRQEFSSRDQMLERIGFKFFDLEDHLYEQGEHYDKWYQDIELLKFAGYSDSSKTWEHISNLIDWRDKRIFDLGCFHGYFCFKVEDVGGIVQGFDSSIAALKTARMINDLRGGHVRFHEWVGGDDLPECDVILCLNTLHHFADHEKALGKMRSKRAIFELKAEDCAIVERHFEIKKRVESHRSNRVILLCDRRWPCETSQALRTASD